MTPFVFHTAESKKLSVIQNKTNFRLTSIGLGIQWLLRSVRIQLWRLSSLELAQVVKARIGANETPVRVSLDELIGEAVADIVNGR